VDGATVMPAPSNSEVEARPLRADAARNRLRILEAAEAVLASQGLAAPIDDIARAAGVGIGTIYRHFPTQEALYEAIVVNRVQRLVDEAQARAGAPDPGATFYGFLSYWVEDSMQHKALVEGLSLSGVDVKAATAEIKQRLGDAVEALLVRAQKAGEVRDDVRIDDVMMLISGACHATAYSGFDPDARRRAVAIMCDGLRPTDRRLPSRARTAGRRRGAKEP
jgi:AcrR family transcriptional regulator